MAPLLPSSNLNKTNKQKPVNYLIYQQHQLYRPINLGRTILSASSRNTPLQPKPPKTSTQPSLPSVPGPSHIHAREQTNASDHRPELEQLADDDSRSSDSDLEIICQLLLPPEAYNKSKIAENSIKAAKHIDSHLPDRPRPGSGSDSIYRTLPDDVPRGPEEDALSRPALEDKTEEEVDQLEEDPAADANGELEEAVDSQPDDRNRNLLKDTSSCLSRHSTHDQIKNPRAEPSSEHQTGKEQADAISEPQSGNRLEGSSSQQHSSQPRPKRRRTRPIVGDSSRGAMSPTAPIIIDSDPECFQKHVDANEVVPLLGGLGKSLISPKRGKLISSNLSPVCRGSNEPRPRTSPRVIGSDGLGFNKDIDTVRVVPPVGEVGNSLITPNPGNPIPEQNNEDSKSRAPPNGDPNDSIIRSITPDLDELKFEEAVNLLKQLDSGRFFLNRFGD
ncbi:hypothetical protein PtB15_14B145 [Puccinia triticina]|nr:hypothetical protein PtB15_14B145 [Puccinia triticina]